MKRDPSLIRLSRDHNRGLALAMHIERDLPDATDEDLAQLYTDVVSFWKSSLLPHFRAECECLLARLVRHVAVGDDLVTRTQSDHLHIDALMATLQDEDDRSVYRRLLGELGELLRVHIRWEEAVLFEATQSRLSASELLALGTDLSERLPEIPLAPPSLTPQAL